MNNTALILEFSEDILNLKSSNAALKEQLEKSNRASRRFQGDLNATSLRLNKTATELREASKREAELSTQLKVQTQIAQDAVQKRIEVSEELKEARGKIIGLKIEARDLKNKYYARKNADYIRNYSGGLSTLVAYCQSETEITKRLFNKSIDEIRECIKTEEGLNQIRQYAGIFAPAFKQDEQCLTSDKPSDTSAGCLRGNPK